MQQTEASVSAAKELIESTNLVAANEARRKELLAEGINPALADQLIEIENQFAEKRKILDVDILLLENALLQVDAESEVAKKLQEQLNCSSRSKANWTILKGRRRTTPKTDNSGKLALHKAQNRGTARSARRFVDPVNQIVETELSHAMRLVRPLLDIVTGSKSAEQAFAQICSKKIGEHFINMAAQMVAEWCDVDIDAGANGGWRSLTGRWGKRWRWRWCCCCSNTIVVF